MPASSGPRLSVSTWSLHRALGETYPDAPGGERPGFMQNFGPPALTLLELPARLAAEGLQTLEICHFHLPRRDGGYLSELRGALDAAGVQLFSLLLDAGDITHPTHHARDLAWAADWLETAADLGAERMRVIAGQSDYSPEAMALSRNGLRELAERGAERGVRITTENWFPLLARPAYVHELLDSLEGAVGLNADFGNWDGPTKYTDLAAILPRAESCHAKCAFTGPDAPDTADYTRCLELCWMAGFAGPYTLIYDGPDADEWNGLRQEAALVRPFLNAKGDVTRDVITE
jgi:hypothetical protein